MASKQISVKIQSKKGSEASYFAEQDQQKLRELRIRAAEEATKKYSDEHKYHCFRCGTRSLAEIDEGKVKIDICVNENCGAVHLDPGELKELIKDQKALPAKEAAENLLIFPTLYLPKKKDLYIYAERTKVLELNFQVQDKRKDGENPSHASRCRDRGQRPQHCHSFGMLQEGEGAVPRMIRKPESLP